MLPKDTLNIQTVLFQFQGYAYDLGVPDSKDTQQLASIFVTVIRNNFAPQFLNEPYFRTIQETHPGLASVFQTTAVDQDDRVCKHILYNILLFYYRNYKYQLTFQRHL